MTRSSAWLSARGDEDARALRKIVEDGVDVPGVCSEEGVEFVLLTVAKFDHELSGRTEVLRRFSRKDAVEVEPVRAAIKRGTRIELSNFFLKTIDVGGGNVGRIRDDEVELLIASDC